MEYSNTVEGQVTVGQDVYVLSRFQLRREQTVSPKEHVWSPGEKEHWNIGDVQQRELDGKPYRFRCIDQNYGDETDRCRQKALFLCETVIPADTGSSYIYERGRTGPTDTSSIRGLWCPLEIPTAINIPISGPG